MSSNPSSPSVPLHSPHYTTSVHKHSHSLSSTSSSSNTDHLFGNETPVVNASPSSLESLSISSVSTIKTTNTPVPQTPTLSSLPTSFSPYFQSPSTSNVPKRRTYHGPLDHPHLAVKHVIGTTACESSGFSASKNYIAYIAGAGVVVIEIHESYTTTTPHLDTTNNNENGIYRSSNNNNNNIGNNLRSPINSHHPTSSNIFVSSERFFCAPPKLLANTHHSSITPSPSSSSSSSESIGITSQSPRERDSLGYLIPSTPIVIKASSQNTPAFGASAIYADEGISPARSGSSSSLNLSPSVSSSIPSSSISSSSSSKDKVKTTTCVALSPDGMLVAMGETGHIPHVLVFSMAPDSARIPLLMLSEHRFGIKRLAFSTCGKYLASLGNTNDGFLHIWQLTLRENGAAHLNSSNKCLSTIHDMKWLPDCNIIITAGIRHLRVWRLPDNEDRHSKTNILNSRNVILGPFNNSNFVSIAPISSKFAVVATDRGEICLLTFSMNSNNTNNNSNEDLSVSMTSISSLSSSSSTSSASSPFHSSFCTFSPQLAVDFPISAITFDDIDQSIWISGPEDELR